MEWFESLALLLGSILVLMAIGMPVALAFLAANIVGAWFFMGGAKGVTLLLNNALLTPEPDKEEVPKVSGPSTPGEPPSNPSSPLGRDAVEASIGMEVA